MGLFHEGTDIKDIAIDAVEGGVSDAIGGYIFDMYVAKTLTPHLGMAGKYAVPVAGLIGDLVLDYIAGKAGSSPAVTAGLAVAGYAMFGRAIDHFVGDPMKTGMPTKSASSVNAFGGLSPVDLTAGAELRY